MLLRIADYLLGSMGTRRAALVGAAAVLLVSVLESGLLRAQCAPSGNGCKSSNNPCTYNVCRTSSFTCQDGAAMWTVVVLGPPNWKRCITNVPPYLGWQCSETWVSCGTTQAFYDANCSMYCDGTSQWSGCQATAGSNQCGGG